MDLQSNASHARRWAPLLAVAAVLTLAGGVLILPIWLGSDDHPSSDIVGAASSVEVSGPAELFSEVGATLTPVSKADVPVVTEKQALQAAQDDGIRSDVQSAINPSVRLVVLERHPIAPGAEGVPTRSQFVYDVLYPDAPVQVHGPMDAPPTEAKPCDLHVLVDAVTGEVIEGFQVGCQTFPSG